MLLPPKTNLEETIINFLLISKLQNYSNYLTVPPSTFPPSNKMRVQCNPTSLSHSLSLFLFLPLCFPASFPVSRPLFFPLSFTVRFPLALSLSLSLFPRLIPLTISLYISLFLTPNGNEKSKLLTKP